jgi:acid phosphatase class B
MKLHAIIDIDGTCSNANHRKYLIDGSQKKNWDLFYDLCHEDAPHNDIKKLVTMLHQSGLYIVYLTGRVERVRDKTTTWLFGHCFPEGSLQMRPDGDKRQDCIVKAEMADRCGLTPENTFIVLDDRDQVVKMWRARGFRCLQVADGNF